MASISVSMSFVRFLLFFHFVLHVRTLQLNQLKILPFALFRVFRSCKKIRIKKGSRTGAGTIQELDTNHTGSFYSTRKMRELRKVFPDTSVAFTVMA